MADSTNTVQVIDGERKVPIYVCEQTEYLLRPLVHHAVPCRTLTFTLPDTICSHWLIALELSRMACKLLLFTLS